MRFYLLSLSVLFITQCYGSDYCLNVLAPCNTLTICKTKGSVCVNVDEDDNHPHKPDGNKSHEDGDKSESHEHTDNPTTEKHDKDEIKPKSGEKKDDPKSDKNKDTKPKSSEKKDKPKSNENKDDRKSNEVTDKPKQDEHRHHHHKSHSRSTKVSISYRSVTVRSYSHCQNRTVIVDSKDQRILSLNLQHGLIYIKLGEVRHDPKSGEGKDGKPKSREVCSDDHTPVGAITTIYAAALEQADKTKPLTLTIEGRIIVTRVNEEVRYSLRHVTLSCTETKEVHVISGHCGTTGNHLTIAKEN